MLITRFIRAPRQGTMAMLVRRMSPAARKELEGKRFDAIGLVQTDLPSLFYFADIGQKAGDVIAAEITGNCPQHISTIAFFGNTAAVSAALAAVQKAQSDK
ncbi:BMC domain-containing protein [Neomoorella carbonis]|uniref:BMC domain-containing protein n=1 Tax=Neomoorella carbonis TaxID=3062783 RepID=UPI0038734885